MPLAALTNGLTTSPKRHAISRAPERVALGLGNRLRDSCRPNTPTVARRAGRYYICTRYLGGKRFSEAVRGHWAIESMHWTLDVTFREDDSRTRGTHVG